MHNIKKLVENMEVKLLVQRKKLRQALESSRYLEEDLKKIKNSVIEEEKRK